MKEAVNLLDEIGKLPSGLSFLGKCVELTNTFGAIISYASFSYNIVERAQSGENEEKVVVEGLVDLYTDSVPGLNVAGAIDKLFFDGYGNQWVKQHVYNDCYPGYKKLNYIM